MSSAGLLLPLSAVPESHLDSSATKGAMSATAHVTFKIVIPPVLFLEVGPASERGQDAQTVAVMSNNHNVSLNATVRASDSALPRGNVILSGAARKAISQTSSCTLGDVTRPVVCTASMP